MKIGLVRRGYSSSGGAEAYLQRFAHAARSIGHECVLFADEAWPRNAWPGEIVPLVGGSPRRFADALEGVRPRDHCDFLLSLERVWKCDAYRAGDGVHAAWLERRARYEPFWRPLLRRFNGKHRDLLELEQALFARGGTSLVIANSEMVKAEIRARFPVPAERIQIIRNGVPSPVCPPGERDRQRQALGLDPFDFVVLFAGSGWQRKGLRYAIEAINQARLSNPVLLVAGRGQRSTMPASKRVRYLGPVPAMAPLLAAADLFVLPSLYEPFSNACLEALAAGLPVLTSAANGFSEILTHGIDGEVLPEPSDSAALARAIEAWAPPARRAAARDMLQAKGARFSVEANVSQTLGWIQEARHTLSHS